MSIILFFVNYLSFSQLTVNNFFDALIHNPENISAFVDSTELSLANRLGINYNEIKNKFLISYDIDENIRKDIIERNTEYNITTLENADEYSKVEFSVTALNYSKYFFFKSGKFIPPSSYYSRNWTTYTSKYFIFKISEPEYFNDYCINKLDEFIDKTADKLRYTSEEKQFLEKEKIYYLLCKDENEIKTISGFDMRGQYFTAFDEILTTYNTHYHELCHFLINYKLKQISLYTLPFFLEGFAVALGGRGGMSPRVVNDLGLYLQKKEILTYDSIIENDAFYSEDASLTYPVAGIYNLFLIKKLGMSAYLDLYKKVNGDLQFLKGIKASDLNLPGISEFNEFLEKYKNDNDIILINGQNLPGTPDGKLKIVTRNADTCYYFSVFGNTISLNPVSGESIKGYTSKIFGETMKTKYNGEIYLIKVDTNYVKIYNCLNNELISEFEKGFSLENENVGFINTKIAENDNIEKCFVFLVTKSLFDMEFRIPNDRRK